MGGGEFLVTTPILLVVDSFSLSQDLNIIHGDFDGHDWTEFML